MTPKTQKHKGATDMNAYKTTFDVKSIRENIQESHTRGDKIRVENLTKDSFAEFNSTNDGNIQTEITENNTKAVISDDINTGFNKEHVVTEDVIAESLHKSFRQTASPRSQYMKVRSLAKL